MSFEISPFHEPTLPPEPTSPEALFAKRRILHAEMGLVAIDLSNAQSHHNWLIYQLVAPESSSAAVAPDDRNALKEELASVAEDLWAAQAQQVQLMWAIRAVHAGIKAAGVDARPLITQLQSPLKYDIQPDYRPSEVGDSV